MNHWSSEYEIWCEGKLSTFLWICCEMWWKCEILRPWPTTHCNPWGRKIYNLLLWPSVQNSNANIRAKFCFIAGLWTYILLLSITTQKTWILNFNTVEASFLITDTTYTSGAQDCIQWKFVQWECRVYAFCVEFLLVLRVFAEKIVVCWL